jgi:hypothetical protein
LPFQILINTWSTFYEAPRKDGAFCVKCLQQIKPGIKAFIVDPRPRPLQ